nr:hypothetical protein Itr_chr06CG17960 [Ipomoea trifida]
MINEPGGNRTSRTIARTYFLSETLLCIIQRKQLRKCLLQPNVGDRSSPRGPNSRVRDSDSGGFVSLSSSCAVTMQDWSETLLSCLRRMIRITKIKRMGFEYDRKGPVLAVEVTERMLRLLRSEVRSDS